MEHDRGVSIIYLVGRRVKCHVDVINSNIQPLSASFVTAIECRVTPALLVSSTTSLKEMPKVIIS